ncbi:nicotinate-nucleotide--dimethylbenzimidazole phosphoribosyltransferase, partial [Eubacterium callanderi]|uniref:nicotinate-nucleotide--dimethylbenzimidazole phosphoribosyltransferase n=1 Tax=Eubacterium callanderi TaxID=53442 RepID=UPI00210AC7A1
PCVDKKMILTMAADHGIAEEGVSAFPQEVTMQMVANIVAGGAGVNVLGKASGAEVRLVDMGVKEDMPELVKKGAIIVVRRFGIRSVEATLGDHLMKLGI